jgi:hypothetical protein
VGLGLATACAEPGRFPDFSPSRDDDDGGTPDAGAPALPPGTPTYHRDVAPLLARACNGCHVAGGIGPFPLDTYETAARSSSFIAFSTRERRMPPYLADASGDCGELDAPSWLTEEEIQMLEEWDLAGAPEGAPNPRPLPPPTLPTLEGQVVNIAPEAAYLPREDRDDDYRCFLAELPPSLAEASDDRPLFLTGWEVHPGAPTVVHHVIAYAPTSDEAAAEARALDAAQDEALGYECFGAAVVDAAPVVLWAPGGGATRLPGTTGIRLDPSRPIIIQVHYNTSADPGVPDLSTIDLSVARSGVAPGYMIPLADLDMALPPRLPEARASTTQRVADYIPLLDLVELPVGVRLHAVYPHMHELGRSLRVSLARADGGESCLLDVPRWDFDWQLLYDYRRPVVFGARDAVTLDCVYDTRGRTTTTTWGEGTADEMCLAFLYASLDLTL